MYGSLPVAGVDGTLKKRFTDAAAAGRVRAKTGTLDSVGALSGYLTTGSGREIAFSIMANNVPASQASPRKAIDAIVAALLEE